MGTREIQLLDGSVTIVDEEDYEMLLSISPVWWVSSSGYANCTHLGFHLQMHRILNNTPAYCDTDHRNGNKLDNCKSNLRTADRSLNMLNRSRIENTPNVCWDKDRSKWVARYGKNKIGRYETREKANQAYFNKLVELGI